MTARIPIDPDQSRRILDAAVRTQTQIEVEPAGPGAPAINGFLIWADEKAVLLEITNRSPEALDGLVGAEAHVRLYGQQRYYFASQIMAAPRWGETRALALTRPAALVVLDRRRFIRAKLAPSSRVFLRWTHRGRQHRHQAMLLNISADGLACKLEDLAAAALKAGDTVRVDVELPDHGRRLEFQATISNKTPASQDHLIVGMQFLPDPRDACQIETLREILAGRETPRIRMEMPA